MTDTSFMGLEQEKANLRRKRYRVEILYGDHAVGKTEGF